MRIVGTTGISRFKLVVLLVGAVLVFASIGFTIWNEARVREANGLAVRYDLVSSTGAAGASDRCAARLLDDYAHAPATETATFPRSAIRLLAPRVCALAAQRNRIGRDGGLTRDDAQTLTLAAIRQYGVARFQTLVNTELAVHRYALASSAATVTRWDRCVAMALSAYDAMGSLRRPRTTYAAGIRRDCARGIRLGLVPPSGAPSRAVTQRLFADVLRRR